MATHYFGPGSDSIMCLQCGYIQDRTCDPDKGTGERVEISDFGRTRRKPS